MKKKRSRLYLKTPEEEVKRNVTCISQRSPPTRPQGNLKPSVGGWVTFHHPGTFGTEALDVIMCCCQQETFSITLKRDQAKNLQSER